MPAIYPSHLPSREGLIEPNGGYARATSAKERVEVVNGRARTGDRL